MNNQPIDAGYANFLKTQGLLNFLQNYNIETLQEYNIILYKLCSALYTQEEIDLFAKFLTVIYQQGYYKSVEDHKKALEVHGLNSVLNH